MEIKSKRFRIIAKPNARETKIERFDPERDAYIVSVKAKPEDNRANIEIIKFFSKMLKAKVRIVSGMASKEKMLEIVQ
ncbi:DUF167 domain-containing protein [Candidatus Woesearchaeota archaeon]|nr:DUF167 domain-containing protein [Candidatus Woesearchaeota archaeon]